MDANARCPECGAPLDGVERCEELFHRALAAEWATPGAGDAHHLLVGTYMLQHPSRFTAEGQAAYRTLIATVVDERLSGPRCASGTAGGSTRASADSTSRRRRLPSRSCARGG